MQEPYANMSEIGSTVDFSLTNDASSAGFVKPYDMQAPALFPDMFYNRQAPAEPIKGPGLVHNPLHENVTMRLYLGSLAFVGLFIFFRCVVRDL